MAKQTTLKISEDLALPLNAVTSTLVVYGGKGMGKTNFGGVLVEELSAAALRWAVLDPMGVWWGMRYAADGKGNGVECLILGGAHGDIPIEPTGGAVVADLVADERVNVIIDISRKANGEMWTISDRIRFVRDYGKQLFRRQGSLVNGQRREPICQVIDEAARFVPQMISSGEAEVAQCMSIWRAIVEEGRNVGIGVVLLTQRSARLNKDVAELADVMLAFRTVGPNSIKAVTDWLGEHVAKEEMKVLVGQVRSLPVGSCLAVSPGWLGEEKVCRIRMRHTFDSSATPKPGESSLKVKGNGARPDLQLYARRMEETIERAKAESVPDLKKRIRELEASAAARPAAAAIAQADPKEIAMLKQQMQDLTDQVGALENQAARHADRMAAARTIAQQLVDALAGDEPVQGRRSLVVKVTPRLESKPEPKPVPAKAAALAEPAGAIDETKKLTGMSLKIAQIVSGFGAEGISRKLLTVLCGTTLGGGFSSRLSEARTAGAITLNGTMVIATEHGRRTYGGQFEAPSSTREVLALWRPKLKGTALQIFDHLVAQRGALISRAALAEAVGTTLGGGFSSRLSEVRSTQLLVEEGTNVGVNRELLFL